MKPEKKSRLVAKGWKFGSADDFLGLTSEESAYIDLKVRLANLLLNRRKSASLTQVDLASRLQSSQSRVAKMEKGDTSVSVDLLVRSLYALGTNNSEIASVIAEPTPQYDSTPRKRRK